MKLQLLKTEASWIQTRIGCYVSLDNQLLDVITPLNSPHESPTLDIPPEGNLKLIFKDMGKIEGYIASVSIPLNLFTKSSNFWIPLFTNPNNDTLHALNSETNPPRIFVNVMNNESFINCDDELFQSFSEIQPDNDSEIVVASQILPPGSVETEFCKTSTFNQQKNVGYVEKLCLQLKKYMVLAQEHKYSALFYKEKSLELESKIGIYENKIQEIKEYYTKIIEQNKDRELNLLERISYQENEIVELQSTVSQLSLNVRTLQHENFYLSEGLNSEITDENK